MPADVVNLAKALVASGVSIPDPDLRDVVNEMATREDEKPDKEDAKDVDKEPETPAKSSSKTVGKTDTKDGK